MQREEEFLSFALLSSFLADHRNTTLKVPCEPSADDILRISETAELRYMARATAWVDIIQTDERPSGGGHGKATDARQLYPFANWLGLDNEPQAAALAHFARKLPMSHKIDAVYELVNPELTARFEQQEVADRADHTKVLMYHGADVVTLMVIAQEGFKTEACSFPNTSCRSVYLSNSSQYSLNYSLKGPHAANEEAKRRVQRFREALQRRGGLDNLGKQSWVIPKGQKPQRVRLPPVHVNSTGMYICETLVPSASAALYEADTKPGVGVAQPAIYYTPVANRVCPKFFVHLSPVIENRAPLL